VDKVSDDATSWNQEEFRSGECMWFWHAAACISDAASRALQVYPVELRLDENNQLKQANLLLLFCYV